MKLLKLKKIIPAIWMFLGFALIAPALSFGADVDIYGEGVVTENELAVYLYADLAMDNLVSYGIKLTYDPGELTVIDASKDVDPIPYTSNGTKWYLGNGTASYRNNPEPDFATPGEVILIGGKLDPADPEKGVSRGTRIFIGMVTFQAADGEMPLNPLLTLSYAKGDGASSYKNFVRLDDQVPQVLDGTYVSFGPVIVQPLGDADGNGSVTPRDIRAIKPSIGDANAPCYMDCDGNGIITPKDIRCIKTRI
ncbi:MAG: hypothetical protein GY737_26300 [Desulfobacteraceae bacterium]|nr:hypothetical protein [Desulfobacteraceae bacterium]